MSIRNGILTCIEVGSIYFEVTICRYKEITFKALKLFEILFQNHRIDYNLGGIKTG